MAKLALKVVENEKTQETIGFRAKTWNVAANLVGFIIVLAALLVDTFVIAPIGIVVGIVQDKYPVWAVLPLTLRFLPHMPLDSEKWVNRPFYRRRK